MGAMSKSPLPPAAISYNHLVLCDVVSMSSQCTTPTDDYLPATQCFNCSPTQLGTENRSHCAAKKASQKFRRQIQHQNATRWMRYTRKSKRQVQSTSQQSRRKM